MTTRRQERIARVVKEAVSDAINHHLSDPRIEGFVSVTRVDVAPDLHNADIFISIFGRDEKGQNKTFAGIQHASKRIRSLLAGKLQSKSCPVLHFYKDEIFKKTLETMRLIDEATRELEERYPDDEDEDDNKDDNEGDNE